jgi:transposase
LALTCNREFCEIAICKDGVVRSAGRVKTTPEALEAFATSLEPTDRVAMEVALILEGHMQRVIVVSPDDTGIAQARTKTYRLDARAPAKSLWQGELDAVWMPDKRCRVLRRRLSRREQLVRSRTRCKGEVHAVLMRQLQGKPPCSDLFGVQGLKWLRSLQLPVEEAETVQAALRQIAFLDREIEAVERLIAKEMLASPDARRLMTVPGVNLIATATFLAAIGDINRFSRSRRLVAYLGLDPRVRQSGEQPARSGRISKRGSASARWALVEAAWSVVCQPGPLRASNQRIRARRGHGKAIVSRRAQARDAVLVHAHRRPGLRPPAAIADRSEAAPARAHRRRARAQGQALRRVGHPPEDAPRRETARRAGASVLVSGRRRARAPASRSGRRPARKRLAALRPSWPA